MTEIIRERYAWYKEEIEDDWDKANDNAWSKLVNPERYLKPDESQFCRCGHHGKDHGYSCIFDDERFCFYKYGDERFKPAEYEIKRCPCRGFEPYRIITEDKEETQR